MDKNHVCTLAFVEKRGKWYRYRCLEGDYTVDMKGTGQVWTPTVNLKGS